MALAAYAAAVASHDEPRARKALARARRTALPRRAAEEVCLMLMLYAGYPAALEGLRLLNGAWPGRARRTSEGGPTQWWRRGRALCRRVYGPAHVRLIPAVERLHPDLARWMEEHGYGRVLARAGLLIRDRELVTVATLAALGWERPLASHLLGARRLGASRATTERALRVGLRGAGAFAWGAAARAWSTVRATSTEGARPERRQPTGRASIEGRPPSTRSPQRKS